MGSGMLSACLLCTAILVGAGSAAKADEDAIIARSVVSKGDTARLQRVMVKARRGEPITVGVIGGSITAGAGASKEDTRYGNRVAAWWRERFPTSKITFVNAGIGATGSNFGALRANRDLLGNKPDFVVVEYAVNDGNDQTYAETMEGLVRQILRLPNRPAAMMVFMMQKNGTNAQEWLSKVGKYYDLPMVSYRDALWPEIEAKRMQLSDLFADIVHPNDHGHEYIARFVTSMLDTVYTDLPANGRIQRAKPTPKPLISDLYENTKLYSPKDLTPSRNNGWTLDSSNTFWQSSTPGSVIEFDIEGRAVDLVSFRVRGATGRARVQVDNTPPVTIDAWYEADWGSYLPTDHIVKGLPEGKHHVRIELLAEKAELSTGHEFRIYNIGTAGVK